MTLLNSVIYWINFKRNYQIQLYREHPVDIQMETLFNLIRRARETEWGKKYDFDKINSAEQFQRIVPLHT